MKYKIFIFLLVSLLPCHLLAAKVSPSQEVAAQILKKFMTIEKHSHDYKQRKLSLNKTLIRMWYEDSNIKKVLIETKDELGTTQDNFYFDKNALILCRSITNNFSLGADGKLSKEKKLDKQYLLYKAGELVKPSSSPNINQHYLDLGIAKRNLLIEILAQAFIKK